MSTATNIRKIDLELLASDVGLPVKKSARTLELLDEGNTVPFITRYRKDQTGGLDEEQIRLIRDAAARLRQVAERKEAILKSIAGQDLLSPELRAVIETADSAKQLEDLYLPYKPRKQTLATQARQRGLGPLADEILSDDPQARNREDRATDFVATECELPNVELVFQGVKHLLAERYSERADVREKLRPLLLSTGYLVSSRIELPSRNAPETPGEPGASQQGPLDASRLAAVERGKSKNKKRKTASSDAAYQDYFEYREPISRIPPHRVLAINRGEREKVLRLRIEGDTEQMFGVAAKLLVNPDHSHARFLRDCVRDAIDRMILPSLEREVRRELTERAEQHAVNVFAKNLRKLLLQPPIRGQRTLAIDPGFRSGCKVAVLDEFGNLLADALIYIVGRRELVLRGRAQIVSLVKSYEIALIAVGNGTACRESEMLAAEIINEELSDRTVNYVIVNEAGASVYSTSPTGREELPDCDPVVRSTISIGRRLQDPLSELVKINPANIGVGMYQHDVKSKPLRESLDAVVESCVNFVGVDVNTASPALLSYVSGLNQLTARRVYEFRQAHGPFGNREQLLQVPGVGEATYIQAAGFLKITDGDNPLDATWIHPESYDVAKQLLSRMDSSVAELFASQKIDRASDTAAAESLLDRGSGLDLSTLADELGVGKWLLRDLLTCLSRPGRDPRDDLPPPVFRSDVMKLDDLRPGMELRGTVLNVVDFGAFVDIGMSDSALVHISRLANRYILDPHEVVSVGDVLTVWVVSVDKDRRRVSLSAIEPGGSGPPTTPARAPQKTTVRKEAAHSTGKSVKGARSTGPPKPKFRRPKKPSAPISDAMAEGKEPLRSFSDLLQFYERKDSADDNSPPQAGPPVRP
jgi:uncharacterized protein